MKISYSGFVCILFGCLLMTGPLPALQTGTQQSTTGQTLQPIPGNNSAGQNPGYQQQLQQQQQQVVAQPQLPPGFPLSAEEQKYIGELLAYWEGTSEQIKRYQCNFTRWQYDHETCNYRNPENHQLVAGQISKGKIRYSDPDHGMYEVTEKWQFAGPPKNPGEDPEYKRPGGDNGNVSEAEKWICDGAKIFEYDYQNKRLYELTLPPEAQGEGLKNSPLPFVFGAEAQELLERYWIRDVTPQQAQGQQYWLECWPKRASDAQAYSKVEIVLSRQPFLPVSIHMYAPNYDEKMNPKRMVFLFEERQINGKLANLADFMKNFINPRTPFGWERVPRDLIQDPVAQQLPDRVGQNPQSAAPGQGR